jgi:cysteine-rich repeat protein
VQIEHYIVLSVSVLIVASALAPAVVRADVIDTEVTISICGDGIVNPGEVCDPGATSTPAYASSTATRICQPNCQGYKPYCGDDILQPRFGEECDDGNNQSGDLCSASCKEEIPTSEQGGGFNDPPPEDDSEPTGSIPADRPTEVNVNGRAYPNTTVHILRDGDEIATVNTGQSAQFSYDTEGITPGSSTFGFWAEDPTDTRSITVTATFEVAEGAQTNISGILIPPTIALTDTSVDPGASTTISGYTVPNASVRTVFTPVGDTLNETEQTAYSDGGGEWQQQFLAPTTTDRGTYNVKPRFELFDADDNSTTTSGYGRTVALGIGGAAQGGAGADINGDGSVNLADFSIMLFNWQDDHPPSDLNDDGIVGLPDFSILLFNWTG